MIDVSVLNLMQLTAKCCLLTVLGVSPGFDFPLLANMRPFPDTISSQHILDGTISDLPIKPTEMSQ